VTNPRVSVKDTQVVGLHGDGLDLEFLLAVTNPNSFKVRLKGCNYNLRVAALPLAKGESRQEVEFTGNATTDVRLPVRVAFNDLVDVISRRPDFAAVPYQLSAGLDVDTPLGVLTVPVEKTGTFAVPESYRPNNVLKKIEKFLNGVKDRW
jgi:LEA14-like dessication related protein